VARELRFTSLAARDVTSARDWYDAQRPGLGAEFVAAVATALDLIGRLPEAAPVVIKDVRRLLLARFPYALYYRLTEEVIEVRACLHTRRDPRRWRSRA
jgi:plasmid stabilization system protein ParE